MQTSSGDAQWRPTFALVWSLACGPVVLAALAAPQGAWWAIGLYHAGCSLAAAVLPVAAGPRPALRRLALAALASAALAVAFAAAVATLPAVQQAFASWRRWGLVPPADIVWLAYYAAVNPWVEERFWRGTLLAPAVRARVGGRTARGLASVGFVVHHACVTIPSFGLGLGAALCVPVLVAGVVWTVLRERTGGIWWSVASHAGADLGLALAAFAVLRR